jgi:hypothetical protein
MIYLTSLYCLLKLLNQLLLELNLVHQLFILLFELNHCTLLLKVRLFEVFKLLGYLLSQALLFIELTLQSGLLQHYKWF